MGSEATPAAFVDALLDVVEECERVLAPHGSLCFELGDTFAGSGGGGDYDPAGAGATKWDRSSGRVAPGGQPYANTFKGGGPGGNGWPLAKSLTLIPESFRWALVYGRNPFNGRETPRWRARNVVRHFRPNPPVGALGDKFRPATSEWVIACKSATRYFDLESVREPFKPSGGPTSNGAKTRNANKIESNRPRETINTQSGAPPLDWCVEDDLEYYPDIVAPTFGYPGAHYATFSPKVIQRFIKAMVPEKVCTVCGEPSRRVVERGRESVGNGAGGKGRNGRQVAELDYSGVTVGWSDCKHNAYRPGVVLDPFAGTGTVGAVATGHGRDAILIDIDERNLALARERIGFLLDESA